MGFVTMYMFYVCWDVMFHLLILYGRLSVTVVGG